MEMNELVTQAKAKGFRPETSGKTLKIRSCPICNKNKAVVFYKDIPQGVHFVAACCCGYRCSRKNRGFTGLPII